MQRTPLKTRFLCGFPVFLPASTPLVSTTLAPAMARRSVDSILTCQSDEEPIPLVLTRPASTSSFLSAAESQRAAAQLVEDYLSTLDLNTALAERREQSTQCLVALKALLDARHHLDVPF